MAPTYHANTETGQTICEWETRITERVGDQFFYHYEDKFFPTFMVSTATKEDWKKAGYPSEDCNSFQTAIWLLDDSPWIRALALRVAHDILDTRYAAIPPACNSLRFKVSAKHIVEKIKLTLA